MLPTFEPGDEVAGNKLAYALGSKAPRRGDVLVFRASSVALPPGLVPPPVLVKRVIGLPGDRVTMTVTINPGGVDDSASDNKAAVTMYVPTGPVPSGANTFTTIPCVVDYGETTP